MQTDNIYLIGKTHLKDGKPCQDYTLSSVVNDVGFAVVSDGCSSGGATDMGSRVIAYSARAAVKSLPETLEDERHNIPLAIKEKQRSGILETCNTLGLVRNDMLATCIFAYFTSETGFVHVTGDGVVAYKTHSGNVYMYRYEWVDNTPFYLAYDVFSENDLFARTHGGDLNAIKLTCESWEHDSSTGHNVLQSTEITLAEGMQGVVLNFAKGSRPIAVPHNIEDLEFIAIFSDGVTQIEGTDWKDAVVQLLAFKTVEGDFAKRRMNFYLRGLQKDNKGPADDIAYAVIHFLKKEVL